jgi:hypothetical protein
MLNHVAYEAARATVTGLSDDERSTLAHARADELISGLGGFIDADAVEVNAATGGDGIYAVTVHYQFNALSLIGASSLVHCRQWSRPSESRCLTAVIRAWFRLVFLG